LLATASTALSSTSIHRATAAAAATPAATAAIAFPVVKVLLLVVVVLAAAIRLGIVATVRMLLRMLPSRGRMCECGGRAFGTLCGRGARRRAAVVAHVLRIVKIQNDRSTNIKSYEYAIIRDKIKIYVP
jgi:hypothetical protein